MAVSALCTTELHTGAHRLLMERSSIRSCHGTQSVHKGHVAFGGSLASAGSHDVSILGRFLPRAVILSSGLSDTRCQLTTALHTQVCHKPEEVRSRAPSRRYDQHASRIAISSAGQSGRISASIARAPLHDSRVGSSLHGSDGAHGVMPCPCPTMLVPSATRVNPPGGTLRLEG